MPLDFCFHEFKFLSQAFSNLHNFKACICQSGHFLKKKVYLMEVVSLVFNTLAETGSDECSLQQLRTLILSFDTFHFIILYID